MASARYANRPRNYDETIDLFAWKKTLTESRAKWRDGKTVGSKSQQTEFASPKEMQAAYEARCHALEAEGWHDVLVGGRKRFDAAAKTKAPKKPSAAATEKELDALSDELAAALRRAKGDAAKEQAALKKAIERFRDARTLAGEPPDEHLVHFFAADGVGLAKKREPALQRLGADAKTFARWQKLLTALAKK